MSVNGKGFTVIRDDRQMTEPVPTGDQRKLVPTDEIIQLGRNLPQVDETAVRTSPDQMADPSQDDPVARWDSTRRDGE